MRPLVRFPAALLAGLLLGLASPVRAEEPEGEGRLSLAAIGLRGTLTYKSFIHFEDTPGDEQNVRNEGILRLEWRRRLARWSRIDIVGRAQGDDAGLARDVTFQVPDRSRFRSILELEEAVLGFQGGPLDVTFGKQIFAWGTADAFNPTDNLNPHDFLDPIDNRKLGVYSAAAHLGAGPVGLTLVFVPFFTPSKTPLRDERWVPPLDEQAGVTLESRELPDRDLENAQYAARLQATVAGWDVAVSYFNGFEHTPVLKRATVPGAVRLTPVFTRMQAAGLDFSTTWGNLEFHGEGAVKMVQRNGREDRFQGLLGLNYRWDIGRAALDRINLILEYGREEVLDTHRDSSVLPTDDLVELGVLQLNNVARDAVFGEARFTFTEDTWLRLRSAVDLTREASGYGQLAVRHAVLPALHVEAGVDAFVGDRDTFWGRWQDNNRVYLFVEYFF